MKWEIFRRIFTSAVAIDSRKGCSEFQLIVATLTF